MDKNIKEVIASSVGLTLCLFYFFSESVKTPSNNIKPIQKTKQARIETIANKEALVITNPKGKDDTLYKTTDGSYKTFEEIYQNAQNELKSEYGK